METALYAQINIICMFILFLLMKHLRKRTAPMPDEVSFRRLMKATFVTLLCDLIGVMLSGMAGGFVNVVLNVVNVIYFALTGYIGLLWLQYVDYKTRADVRGLRSRTRWYCIPMVLLAILSICSPWTGWLFSIDQNNNYHRGVIFLSQVLLGFAYIAYSTVLAIRTALKSTQPAKKRESWLLASFIVLPTLGGVIQAIVYGIPTLWTGTTLSILIVFINLQNKLLSMDGLTGVNSRVQMDRYIAGLMGDGKSVRNGKKLQMLILDIDGFRSINHDYGHVMADNVLKTVSAILRKVCDNRNDFVARFGGDEFAVICSDKDEDYLMGLMTAIQREAEHYNETSHNPFRVRLDIGRATLGEVADDDMDGMILRATQQIKRLKAEREEDKQ